MPTPSSSAIFIQASIASYATAMPSLRLAFQRCTALYLPGSFSTTAPGLHPPAPDPRCSSRCSALMALCVRIPWREAMLPLRRGGGFIRRKPSLECRCYERVVDGGRHDVVGGWHVESALRTDYSVCSKVPQCEPYSVISRLRLRNPMRSGFAKPQAARFTLSHETNRESHSPARNPSHL